MRKLSRTIALVLGLVMALPTWASNESAPTQTLSMNQALPMKGAALISLGELRSESLPKDVRNLLKKAIKLDEKGRTSRAIEVLDLAIQEAPDFVQAHVAEAIGFLKLGELAVARSHSEIALKLDPESIPAREIMGAVELFEGNASGARSRLEALLEDAPRRASTHEILGIALQSLRCLKKSAEHLDLARELRKHPPKPVYDDSDMYLLPLSWDLKFPFR